MVHNNGRRRSRIGILTYRSEEPNGITRSRSDVRGTRDGHWLEEFGLRTFTISLISVRAEQCVFKPYEPSLESDC